MLGSPLQYRLISLPLATLSSAQSLMADALMTAPDEVIENTIDRVQSVLQQYVMACMPFLQPTLGWPGQLDRLSLRPIGTLKQVRAQSMDSIYSGRRVRFGTALSPCSRCAGEVFSARITGSPCH